MEFLGNVTIPKVTEYKNVSVSSPLSGDGSSANPIEAPAVVYDTEPTYTTLWETTTPFANGYAITLNDSIDNYDELIYYGSADRGGNATVRVMTEYPVCPGHSNAGGPFICNTWQTGNAYWLCNGTQVWISGTSGFISASYYWGMQNGGTGFEANRYTTARNADVHPYKIVGVKY